MPQCKYCLYNGIIRARQGVNNLRRTCGIGPVQAEGGRLMEGLNWGIQGVAATDVDFYSSSASNLAWRLKNLNENRVQNSLFSDERNVDSLCCIHHWCFLGGKFLTCFIMLLTAYHNTTSKEPLISLGGWIPQQQTFSLLQHSGLLRQKQNA